jgi:BASS family bile acid:Na+ symporter
MGAQLAMAEALAALRNVRFMVMTVVWGWVLCPSLAYLLVKIIPMEQPYTIGLILLGMTPCAPFMPMMVKKARGDLGYTGAIMLLAAIAPLMTIQADSRSVVMVALGIPVTLIFGFLAARWYANHPLQEKML